MTLLICALPPSPRAQYLKRLDSVEHGGLASKLPAGTAARLTEPLPFESLGIHALAALRLGPLLRGFTAAMYSTADAVSGQPQRPPAAGEGRGGGALPSYPVQFPYSRAPPPPCTESLVIQASCLPFGAYHLVRAVSTRFGSKVRGG